MAMSIDERDECMGRMYRQKEEAGRELRCYQCKAYQYGKTLSLLASVLDDPTDKKAWERVREEMNIPKHISFGAGKPNNGAWLPEIPAHSDIVKVLQDIYHCTDELKRLDALLA